MWFVSDSRPIFSNGKPSCHRPNNPRSWYHNRGRLCFSQQGPQRSECSSPTCSMNFPDLAPWFDNVSDDYDELPSGEREVSYDE